MKEATKMKTKVRLRPGRHGFRLLNPELLDCKFVAKVELEECYDAFLNTCMAQCEHELLPLKARISELKDLILTVDEQIPPVGPPVLERNSGVQQMVFSHPPFAEKLSYEFGTQAQQVQYQPAYNTAAEMEAAIARDRRAQRAVWQTNLRLPEVKKSILEKKKIKLERGFKEKSELGVGYGNYQFNYQA